MFNRISQLLKWGVARFADAVGSRLVRPDGAVLNVPHILSNGGHPRIIIPSGTANSSGRLTLNAALPWVLPSLYVWVPENVVSGVAVGAWYLASMSAGNIIQLAGAPATTAGAYTQTTAAVTFSTVTVPGGVMGANGGLRVSQMYANTGSANNKVIQSMFAGYLFAANNTFAGGITAYGYVSTIRNLGSEGAQLRTNTFNDVGTTSSATAIAFSQIDTSVSRAVLFTGSMSATAVAANEYLALMGVTVEVLPGV